MKATKPFAFVLMPFGKEFDDVYRLGIQETAKALDVIAERVDEQIYTESILERIYRQIEAADFIIADMTGRNPNVFYEVGYAHAKGKICMLITKSADDIPFDLKHHRHIVYGGSIHGLKETLLREIEWIKGQIAEEKTELFQVTIVPMNTALKTSDWSHEGSFGLQIDVQNKSLRRGPEIDAVYLYTSASWTFYQDGSECSHTPHEGELGDRRHMLTTKASRIGKDAWIQIRCEGRKQLWRKLTGMQPQEIYKQSGYINLEIVTSEGSFRFREELDVEFEEFPF